MSSLSQIGTETVGEGDHQVVGEKKEVLIDGVQFQGDDTALLPLRIPTDSSLFQVLVTSYLKLQKIAISISAT